jgi:L-threonine-O-3-phosphate decarboxylase
LVRPRHGGNLAWAAAIAGCPAFSIVDFSASINPLGPPQSALAAIQQGLDLLKRYPNPDYAELRDILADYHQIKPDYLIPGNGSAELLTWASRELADLSVTYLITPAFGDYKRSLLAFDAKVLSCCLFDSLDGDLSNALPRRGDSRIALTNQPSGLLLNNPHNPTGKLWRREEIIPLLDRFALVVIDEAFMDFLPPEEDQSLISLVKDYPNLVILRSLTKFYSLPGLRIGYAIAHPQRLQRWQTWRDPWSVNILAECAAKAIIRDVDFQQQTWRWLPSARAELFEGLQNIPQLQPLPSAVNFLLVETNIPSSQLQEKLLKDYQILIRDCLSFPELGDRYFRIAVRSLPENQNLLQALKQVIANFN